MIIISLIKPLVSEIGDLLSMKSKYGPGGEYEPEWKPPGPPGPPPETGMPPPPDVPDVAPPPPPVKPAWRTVHPRPKKKKKQQQNTEAQAHAQAHPVASTSAPMPQVAPMPMSQMAHMMRHPDPGTQMRGSWAAWAREWTFFFSL